MKGAVSTTTIITKPCSDCKVYGTCLLIMAIVTGKSFSVNTDFSNRKTMQISIHDNRPDHSVFYFHMISVTKLKQ